MTTIVIPPNYLGHVDKPTLQDDSGVVRAGTLTATLSDTTNAYIAVDGGKVKIVTRPDQIPGEGVTLNLTLTFSGTAANGGALPDVSYPVQLKGPNTPLATQIVPGPVAVTDKIGQNIPADPGTATVTL